MHHLLSAFFALIFSAGHGQTLHTPVAPSTASFSPSSFAVQSLEPTPSRQQGAFAGCLNGYSGSSCAPSAAASNDHASSRSRPSASIRLAFVLPRR